MAALHLRQGEGRGELGVDILGWNIQQEDDRYLGEVENPRAGKQPLRLSPTQ